MRLKSAPFHFDPNYSAKEIAGWKGRLEVRALPALTFDAETYEDDELNGTDYFIGARLQVPLSGGWKKRFKPGKRPFAARLLENVIRDPQVRVKEGIEQTLDEVREERKKDRSTHIIKDGIEFVNNANTTDQEDGTAEHPHNTIQEGVDAAESSENKTVYTFAGEGSYEENVEITGDGVTLWGEGKEIEGLGGKSFGGGNFPVIDGNVGGVNGPGLHITANDTTVQGVEFIHSPGGINPGNVDGVFNTFPIDGTGLLAENANHFTLSCNYFHDNERGILGLGEGLENYTIDISDNIASRNTDTAILLAVGDLSGPTRLRINNNVAEDNGLGVFGGASGIFVSLFDVGDEVIAEVNGNQANRNTDNGIFFATGFVEGNAIIHR